MTWECWRCFYCNKRFSDEKSHMAHMVSMHQLGLSWDHYCLVPSQVWQGLAGLDEDAKERTFSLDDSVTVDHTYRRCLVKMAKFRIPCEDGKILEQKEPQKCDHFGFRVQEIRHELGCLKHLFDRKEKQCYTSDAMAAVDTEIVQYFARLKKLKQDLSDLCFYDCKNDILPHISSFLQNNNLLDHGGGDGGLWSWACKRFNGLLCSVRCSYLPDSVSTQLESSGKVLINIEHDNSGLRFGYFGLSWKFDGQVPFKGTTRIKGSFTFSGISWASCGGFTFYRDVVLDDCKMTYKMPHVRTNIGMYFTMSLKQKLLQFEDEFRKKVSEARR